MHPHAMHAGKKKNCFFNQHQTTPLCCPHPSSLSKLHVIWSLSVTTIGHQTPFSCWRSLEPRKTLLGTFHNQVHHSRNTSLSFWTCSNHHDSWYRAPLDLPRHFLMHIGPLCIILHPVHWVFGLFYDSKSPHLMHWICLTVTHINSCSHGSPVWCQLSHTPLHSFWFILGLLSLFVRRFFHTMHTFAPMTSVYHLCSRCLLLSILSITSILTVTPPLLSLFPSLFLFSLLTLHLFSFLLSLFLHSYHLLISDLTVFIVWCLRFVLYHLVSTLCVLSACLFFFFSLFSVHLCPSLSLSLFAHYRILRSRTSTCDDSISALVPSFFTDPSSRFCLLVSHGLSSRNMAMATSGRAWTTSVISQVLFYIRRTCKLNSEHFQSVVNSLCTDHDSYLAFVNDLHQIAQPLLTTSSSCEVTPQVALQELREGSCRLTFACNWMQHVDTSTKEYIVHTVKLNFVLCYCCCSLYERTQSGRNHRDRKPTSRRYRRRTDSHIVALVGLFVSSLLCLQFFFDLPSLLISTLSRFSICLCLAILLYHFCILSLFCFSFLCVRQFFFSVDLGPTRCKRSCSDNLECLWNRCVWATLVASAGSCAYIYIYVCCLVK